MPTNLTTVATPNLVNDASGQVTAILTIGAGSTTLISSTALWVSGDAGVNKCINVANAGAINPDTGLPLVHSTFIDGYTSPTQITLRNAAVTALSATSTIVEWGTDNRNGYLALRDWGQLQTQSRASPLDLTMTPGKYMVRGGSFPCFLNDGDNLTGIMFANLNLTGVEFNVLRVGGESTYGDNGATTLALFHSAYHGETTITLKTPAQASNFSVGEWVVLLCNDLMGYGYPQNPAIFEFKEIQGISGGVFTFTEALRHTYLSTLPIWYDPLNDSTHPGGNTGFAHQGGPASMFKLQATWNNQLVWTGMTVRSATAGVAEQTYGGGRDITFIDCYFYGDGYVPSSSKNLTLIRGRGSDSELEFDKMVENFVARETTFGQVKLQSQCFTTTFIDCVTDRTLQGTGGDFTYTGGSIGLSGGNPLICGPIGFGITNKIYVSGTNIAGPVGISNNRVPLSNYTYLGNGLFRSTAGPYAMSQPNQWCFLSESDGTSTPTIFQVWDVWTEGLNADGTPTYIYYKTSLTDATLPSYSNISANHITAVTAPNVTFRNCTGHWSGVGLSNAPARRPLGEYSERVLSSNILLGVNSLHPEYQFVRGYLTELQIQVNTPYTGVNGTDVVRFTCGGFTGTAVNNIDVSVNLRNPGTRIITPSSVSGAQSGDTLGSAPGTVWLRDYGGLYGTVSSSESAGVQASVKIIVKCDQGVRVDPDNIPPPRLLRLHS